VDLQASEGAAGSQSVACALLAWNCLIGEGVGAVLRVLILASDRPLTPQALVRPPHSPMCLPSL
jgi:hypothetical protein